MFTDYFRAILSGDWSEGHVSSEWAKCPLRPKHTRALALLWIIVIAYP
jgi:hypothetical protein